MFRRGKVVQVAFWYGSWGVAGSGSDRHVMVRQLRLVHVCFGMVSCGMAVMVSHGRCGTFRYGLLWQFRLGALRYVKVGYGEVR